jgi:hypothetical protein
MAIALTYDDTLSRVRVAVTAIPAAADEVLVERSTDQFTWTTVRGGAALTPSGSAANVDDYEFVEGVPNHYRASYVDTGPASFVAAGTADTAANAAGTSTVTPTLPTHIAGDLLLVWVSIRNSGAGAVITPVGWTALVTSGNTALLGLRAAAAGTANPVISFTGGVANATLVAQACALRNVNLTPAASGAQLNGSAQNMAHPALTVPGNGHIVVAAAWKQDDWTSVAPLATMTEIQEAFTTLGDDAGQVWDYVVQTTATNIAAGSFTVTGGATAISRAVIAAFAPADYITQDTTSITPVLTEVWLKSVSKPFLNRPVTVILDPAQSITREPRDGVFNIVGRSYPVAVTDLRGSRRWTMQIRTFTASDAEDMDLILGAGDIMHVHAPSNCQVRSGYVRIATTTQSWHPLRPDESTFTLPLTEVAAPANTVVGAVGTWATVLALYPTWADVLAANASWADLLQLVGSPADTVVP